MIVAEKDAHRKGRSRQWWRNSLLKSAAIAIVLLVAGHTLLESYAGSRHRHTCVICRLERIDYKWRFGSPDVTYNETSCSQWYRSHVEPHHEHVWSPNSAMILLNFYGRVMGAADNEERPGRAIWRLTPDEQISIYQHFSDPGDAKRIFISLIDPAVMYDRHDLVIVDSLREWIESEFAEDWRQPDSQ